MSSGEQRTIAIVGGGFGGIGAAAMLRRAGHDAVTVFERGERIGGVWHANTYPGAACDIPSHLYDYSFAPNPRWSRRYAPQAEIQAYLEDVARRHAIDVRTGTDVTAARWEGGRWHLETSAGPHEADVLIAACGQLAHPSIPPLRGLDGFEGPIFHTARWRHDVDLAGKRVAVVGTGCSAIQVVPAIQPEVAQVDVYQRSPGWTIPKLDFPYRERTLRLFERFPFLLRLDRAAIMAIQEIGAAAMTKHPRLLPAIRAVGRSQINRAIKDPELRRKVTPRDEVGCKRIMLTDDWYPTLTRPNVALVTERIARDHVGRRAAEDGVERPADVLVLATGFKTHGFVAPMEIAGEGGRTLAEAWGDVPRAYLGVTVPELPEPLPPLRAQHQRRDRLGDLHDRGRDGARAGGAPRARAGGRAARSRSAARRPTRSTASCGPRSPGPSGTAAARTGTSTRTATTRTSGRGCGARTGSAPPRSTRAPTSSRADQHPAADDQRDRAERGADPRRVAQPPRDRRGRHGERRDEVARGERLGVDRRRRGRPPPAARRRSPRARGRPPPRPWRAPARRARAPRCASGAAASAAKKTSTNTGAQRSRPAPGSSHRVTSRGSRSTWSTTENAPVADTPDGYVDHGVGPPKTRSLTVT